MIRPPTIAPGMDVKPPRISTGSALSAISESENCTPSLAPHIMPATSATRPATAHTMKPDLVERDADGLRGLVIVGDRAQRPADPRHLKEHGEHEHHDGTDRGGDQLGRIDQQPAGKHRLQE